MKKLSAVLFVAFLVTGCSAEVGSEAWCNDMKETPKGEWTSNQAKDYAKHCIF